MTVRIGFRILYGVENKSKYLCADKSYYEIVYASIIKVNDEVKDKKDLEKIILCDVPTAIYPDLEKSFLDLIHNSGHPSIKLEKKVDFQKLYNEKFN